MVLDSELLFSSMSNWAWVNLLMPLPGGLSPCLLWNLLWTETETLYSSNFSLKPLNSLMCVYTWDDQGAAYRITCSGIREEGNVKNPTNHTTALKSQGPQKLCICMYADSAKKEEHSWIIQSKKLAQPNSFLGSSLLKCQGSLEELLLFGPQMAVLHK